MKTNKIQINIHIVRVRGVYLFAGPSHTHIQNRIKINNMIMGFLRLLFGYFVCINEESKKQKKKKY